MDVLMFKPTNFDVLGKDKHGNTHMDPLNRPDVDLALTEWTQLADSLRALSVNAHLLDTFLDILGLNLPGTDLPDITFTANSAFTFTGKDSHKYALLANFRPERRRGEREYFDSFFRNVLGYTTISIPPGLYFEGAGDAIPFGDVVFVGHGFRTTQETLKFLEIVETMTGKRIVPLELKKPTHGVAIPYHMDTAMMVFNRNDRVVIAYPDAFAESSYALLKKEIQRCGGFLIEASYEEFANLSLNAVVVPRSDIIFQLDSEECLSIVDEKIRCAMQEMRKNRFLRGVVITSDTANERLQNTIQVLGYHLITLPLSEFHKSGGGAFCLTKILE
ncbi:hypothetical protein CL630_03885 [bacterium]|nr:hypothetical protein [bacterium]|tara:strand:+ start:59096 stop:60091 length:996 start_codon:yes stop_codon:yes gene_type:complete